MIQKYRKKPVVIEAIKLTVDNIQDAMIWCGETALYAELHKKSKSLYIHTLEGAMQANIGDWVIKGIKGEFYPCKNDIFEMTYELVEEGKEETTLDSLNSRIDDIEKLLAPERNRRREAQSTSPYDLSNRFLKGKK